MSTVSPNFRPNNPLAIGESFETFPASDPPQPLRRFGKFQLPRQEFPEIGWFSQPQLHLDQFVHRQRLLQTVTYVPQY